MTSLKQYPLTDIRWTMDMIGSTHDFTGGAADPVTGMTVTAVAGTLAEWTTLQRSNAGIQATLNNATGHQVKARITLDLPASIPLAIMDGYTIYFESTATTLSTVASTIAQMVFYSSSVQREGSQIMTEWDGANIRVGHNLKRANSWSGTVLHNITNGNNMQRMYAIRGMTEQQAYAHEIGTNFNAGAADIVIDSMLGATSDGPPRLLCEFDVPNGGNMDILFSEIGTINRIAT
ncbi:hypothetical protein HN371_00485 [Candidatus Poribacteria bacterium]|jgi:hypothetical protein|nr:hypothetical protein [Candidatus Poribacteria bacterium]MBT7101168.1 hypothetical protein [Candidatus Poribacteria bacterium]